MKIRTTVVARIKFDLFAYNDFLNWSPHLHALAVSGTFRGDGSFEPVVLIQENILRELFEAEVFKLLLTKGQPSSLPL